MIHAQVEEPKIHFYHPQLPGLPFFVFLLQFILRYVEIQPRRYVREIPSPVYFLYDCPLRTHMYVNWLMVEPSVRYNVKRQLGSNGQKESVVATSIHSWSSLPTIPFSRSPIFQTCLRQSYTSTHTSMFQVLFINSFGSPHRCSYISRRLST